MKNIAKFIFASLTVVGLFFLLSNPASAQQNQKKLNLSIPDSSNKQIVTTIDGSANLGRIIEIGENEIRFETELGVMTIPIAKIEKIELVPLKAIKKGKVWFPNPNKSRMFFAPTARMLDKGEVYFADYYVFFPSVSYGITKNFTFGGGISIFPGVSLNDQFIFLTPKLGIKAAKDFSLAAGVLYIKLPNSFDNNGEDNEENVNSVGIAYSVATFGSEDANITVGMGFGFVDKEFADRPVILLGGEKRVSRRIALVTENWFIPKVDHPMSIYGLRFMGSNMSVDLGFIYVFKTDLTFPGIPYIDFMIIF